LGSCRGGKSGRDMSLKIAIGVVAVAATVGGAFLLRHEPGHSQTAHPAAPGSASTPVVVTRHAELSPPRLPSREAPDISATNAYKQSRLARLDEFNTWVREAGVSPEQEAKVLQLLSDAQAIYDQTESVRQDLRRDASRMRDARMTPEQRQRLKDATQRYMDALKRQDKDAIVKADAERSAVWNSIDESLEATAPSDERAVFDAVMQVDQDLETQVMAALADILTPRQVEAFKKVATVSMLLQLSNNRWVNEQYAKELASRPR
jgi:hypothetical protein